MSRLSLISQKTHSALAMLNHRSLVLLSEWPRLQNWYNSAAEYFYAFFDYGRHLLQHLGAFGMFIIAIFDSSLLSIPEINDLLIIRACARHWNAVLYYPLIAASGSVIGCLILFHIMRRGGKAVLHRRFSEKNIARVETFFARYGVLALIIPSLCPPPTPFKIFVATAGALQFPRRRFIIAILFGRFTRYLTEGIFAVIYGRRVIKFLHDHPGKVALIVFLVVTIGFIAGRLAAKWQSRRQAKAAVAVAD